MTRAAFVVPKILLIPLSERRSGSYFPKRVV